jgi:hypothetical protein
MKSGRMEAHRSFVEVLTRAIFLASPFSVLLALPNGMSHVQKRHNRRREGYAGIAHVCSPSARQLSSGRRG